MHDKKYLKINSYKKGRILYKSLKIISYIMIDAATGYVLSHLTLCVCQPAILEQKT